MKEKSKRREFSTDCTSKVYLVKVGGNVTQGDLNGLAGKAFVFKPFKKILTL